MNSLRHYFKALLSNIEPSSERKDLCSTLPGEVRDWLENNEFQTSAPHTRLSGSYKRQTAIRIGDQDINDVDILLFLPEEELENTPSHVISRVKTILDEYPDTSIDTKVQRRSVRLDFPSHDLHLDIVPAVAADGLKEKLQVPNKAQGEWIDSDPLGYGRALSTLNDNKNGNVVPLIKMMKAWRDEHMKTRRPKSYVLEAILFEAINSGDLVVTDLGWGQILGGTFDYVWDRWQDLFENGTGVPRVKDPQLGHIITTGWERTHFETFMRRIQESQKASINALEAMHVGQEDQALEYWKKVFGSLWPAEAEAKSMAEAEARTIQPGSASVSATGLAIGSIGVGTPVPRTRYYGDDV